jgi:hypothetical protein
LNPNQNHLQTSSEHSVYVFSIPYEELNVTRSALERAMGYTKNDTPHIVSGVVDEVLEALPQRVAVKCGFRILPQDSISITPPTFSCCQQVFNAGPIIPKRLRKSVTLAVFVTTVGPYVEKWSHEVMADGDMMKGYIIDTAGSELAEQAADWLEVKLQETISERGWKITSRYSPGYCDWVVAEQHKLFSLLPEKFCGITLTPSALMVPIKSVSGVIGLGPHVKKEEYQCSICDMKDCIRRRE